MCVRPHLRDMTIMPPFWLEHHLHRSTKMDAPPSPRCAIQMCAVCVCFPSESTWASAASKPISGARGAGRTRTVVDQENGQFNAARSSVIPPDAAPWYWDHCGILGCGVKGGGGTRLGLRVRARSCGEKPERRTDLLSVLRGRAHCWQNTVIVCVFKNHPGITPPISKRSCRD